MWKKVLGLLLCVSLLATCVGCGGSHKNQMTKEKWTNLKEYSEWFDTIYSETDYAKDIEVYNFIETEKELTIHFDGDDEAVEEYFKFLIETSNEFVRNNEDYFGDIERIQIEYDPAGRPCPILISTYPESRLEELDLDTENDNLEFRYISLDASFITLNMDCEQKYNCNFVYLNNAIPKDKKSGGYDISVLNMFENPQIIILNNESSDDEELLTQEIQNKFPDVKVLYR